MDPVFLGGICVDRCYSDEMFWFEAIELQRVLSTASQRSSVTSAARVEAEARALAG